MVSDGVTRRCVIRTALGTCAILLLAACGNKAVALSASPTPAPTPPVPPPQTTTPATPAPAPTAMPAPSATPTVAPLARATGAPATPIGAATSTPAGESVAALNARFPGRRWDFGLRPLLFQIDNAPDARPQSGLGDAYVVYETPAEGGITRFTTLFVQQALAQIGNLRSGRLVDIDLTRQWDGVLVHVGASTPVEQMLSASGIARLDLNLVENLPAAWRTSDRVAPYNLYSSMARLRPFLAGRGVVLRVATPRAFPVGPLPAGQSGTVATGFTIPYGSPSTADYTWDATAGGYRRFVDSQALVDANTGKQIVVANVVAHFAQEIVTNIIEDEEGSQSLQFVLRGTGKAVLLRDGKRFDLTWHRDQPSQLTGYAFADGSPATFAPGNVWIAFVPTTMQAG